MVTVIETVWQCAIKVNQKPIVAKPKDSIFISRGEVSAVCSFNTLLSHSHTHTTLAFELTPVMS